MEHRRLQPRRWHFSGNFWFYFYSIVRKCVLQKAVHIHCGEDVGAIRGRAAVRHFIGCH
jgi:hypothetical protein